MSGNLLAENQRLHARIAELEANATKALDGLIELGIAALTTIDGLALAPVDEATAAYLVTWLDDEIEEAADSRAAVPLDVATLQKVRDLIAHSGGI